MMWKFGLKTEIIKNESYVKIYSGLTFVKHYLLKTIHFEHGLTKFSAN